MPSHAGRSSDQANPDREIQLGPGPIRCQYFCGIAANGQRQATAVAERERSAANQGTHRAGQLCVGGGERLDGDSGGAEQPTHPGNVELGVNQLPYDFSQIRSTQDSATEMFGYDVASLLVMDQRQDG